MSVPVRFPSSWRQKSNTKGSSDITGSSCNLGTVPGPTTKSSCQVVFVLALARSAGGLEAAVPKQGSVSPV